MSDWQKGDLALCVRAPRISTPSLTRVGGVYTVLREARDGQGAPVLDLDGIPFVGSNFKGHIAARFRKVTPPKADEFDREIIDLMAGKKVPA